MIHVTDAMTSRVIDAVLHAFHTGPASGRTNEEWNAAVRHRRAEVAKVLDQIIADAVGIERAAILMMLWERGVLTRKEIDKIYKAREAEPFAKT